MIILAFNYNKLKLYGSAIVQFEKKQTKQAKDNKNDNQIKQFEIEYQNGNKINIFDSEQKYLYSGTTNGSLIQMNKYENKKEKIDENIDEDVNVLSGYDSYAKALFYFTMLKFINPEQLQNPVQTTQSQIQLDNIKIFIEQNGIFDDNLKSMQEAKLIYTTFTKSNGLLFEKYNNWNNIITNNNIFIGFEANENPKKHCLKSILSSFFNCYSILYFDKTANQTLTKNILFISFNITSDEKGKYFNKSTTQNDACDAYIQFKNPNNTITNTKIHQHSNELSNKINDIISKFKDLPNTQSLYCAYIDMCISNKIDKNNNNIIYEIYYSDKIKQIKNKDLSEVFNFYTTQYTTAYKYYVKNKNFDFTKYKSATYKNDYDGIKNSINNNTFDYIYEITKTITPLTQTTTQTTGLFKNSKGIKIEFQINNNSNGNTAFNVNNKPYNINKLQLDSTKLKAEIKVPITLKSNDSNDRILEFLKYDFGFDQINYFDDRAKMQDGFAIANIEIPITNTTTSI